MVFSIVEGQKTGSVMIFDQKSFRLNMDDGLGKTCRHSRHAICPFLNHNEIWLQATTMEQPFSHSPG